MNITLLISLATNIKSSLWSLWTIQKTHQLLNATMLLMGCFFISHTKEASIYMTFKFKIKINMCGVCLRKDVHVSKKVK